MPQPSTVTNCDTATWKDVDHGLSCGECTVLADNMGMYQTCSNYCEAQGRVCTEAYEEQDDNCLAREQHDCDHIFDYTSDAICTCGGMEAYGCDHIFDSTSINAQSAICNCGETVVESDQGHQGHSGFGLVLFLLGMVILIYAMFMYTWYISLRNPMCCCNPVGPCPCCIMP